jgi:hypothetical protein
VTGDSSLKATAGWVAGEVNPDILCLKFAQNEKATRQLWAAFSLKGE